MIEKGWRRKTINREVQLIVNVFKWGGEEELIPGEVVYALQCVRPLKHGAAGVKESKVKPVPMDLVKPLQDKLPPQVWDMIRLQLLSGARR